METRPCFAILHYDGTRFSGWQLQPDARTVQAEIEAVLARLTNHEVRVVAAGRTDAGVHALGQTISFAVPDRWNPQDLAGAMNSLLPDDVWVARAGAAPKGFDARRHATARLYRYVIGCDGECRSPFRRHWEWPLGRPLDVATLTEATAPLLGRHDFTPFAAAGQEKPHYECELFEATWSQRPRGQGVIFRVGADRFLHRMVRFMVGTVVEIGLGKRPIGDMERLVTLDHNSETSAPAPPQGLYLESVTYPQLESAEAS